MLVNFGQISHIALVFLFPTLNELVTAGNCQQPAFSLKNEFSQPVFSLKNSPYRFCRCYYSIVAVYREVLYLER